MQIFEAAAQRFSSLQEELVFGLSTRLLGHQYLFCPDDYGKSKEPCDVAWVVGRCAILIYMTRSGGSYQKKINHNLAQYKRWMRKWKSGIVLSGRCGADAVKFTFGEIDYIVVLSVIEDGELGCEKHYSRIEYSSSAKICACATIPLKLFTA